MSREIGDLLEDKVFHAFEDHGIEIKKFNNSGALNKNDSDLHTENFQIECKRTNSKKDIDKPSFKNKDWIKLCKEARSRNKKPMLFISGKDVNNALAVMRLQDIVELLEQK